MKRWTLALLLAPALDADNGMGRVTGNFVIDRNECGVGFNPPTNPIEAEVPVQFDVTFKKP